jgi:predicted nucleic acid-binding protein
MFLLDTNVVSAVRKRHPAPAAWMRRQPRDVFYLSVVTLGEILSGARRRALRDPAAGEALEAWLNRLRGEYANRVLPIDEAIALEWGRIAALRTRGVADGLIAATAIVHGLTVATRNVADFADTGVALVNPWEE